MTDYNDFGQQEKVSPKAFKGARLSGGKLNVELPAMSIVSLTLR